MPLTFKDPLICIDCETTGLDPTTDRLIEVAVVKFNSDEILESYETLVDPEIPIPPETTAIHHITDEIIDNILCSRR